MIFDDDGFEYDPCWDCPYWSHGCNASCECPQNIGVTDM